MKICFPHKAHNPLARAEEAGRARCGVPQAPHLGSVSVSHNQYTHKQAGLYCITVSKALAYLFISVFLPSRTTITGKNRKLLERE